MSDSSTTMVSMSELEQQIEIAKKALTLATEFEVDSGYDIDHTMERCYAEGFLEALEFIYILQNGHGYDEQ